jgi:hypothetical protein
MAQNKAILEGILHQRGSLGPAGILLIIVQQIKYESPCPTAFADTIQNKKMLSNS